MWKEGYWTSDYSEVEDTNEGQVHVACHCLRRLDLMMMKELLDDLGFSLEFFWPWPWSQVLGLEQKVFDNIIADWLVVTKPSMHKL